MSAGFQCIAALHVSVTGGCGSCMAGMVKNDKSQSTFKSGLEKHHFSSTCILLILPSVIPVDPRNFVSLYFTLQFHFYFHEFSSGFTLDAGHPNWEETRPFWTTAHIHHSTFSELQRHLVGKYRVRQKSSP